MEFETAILSDGSAPAPSGLYALAEAVLQANLALIFTLVLALFFLVTLILRIVRSLFGDNQPTETTPPSDPFARPSDKAAPPPLQEVLEAALNKPNRGHRLVLRPPLDEVIARPGWHSRHVAARAAQIDYGIIDGSGAYVCAVEVQSGRMPRDAEKCEALRRARIPLVEVPADYDAAHVENALRRALARRGNGSEHRHTAIHM